MTQTVAQNLTEVLNLLEKQNGTGADACIAAENAIVDHAASPNFRLSIAGEVRQLTGHVLAIEEHFTQIGRVISSIDSLKKLTVPYAPIWTTLHNDFISLIFSSRRSVVRINSKISGMLDSLLPMLENQEYSIDEKQESLTAWIDSLDSYEKEANILDAQFNTMRQGVENFKRKIVEDAKAGVKATGNEIMTLERTIDKLKGDIDACKGFFAATFDIVGRSVPTFGALFGTSAVSGGAYVYQTAQTTSSVVSSLGGVAFAGNITTASGVSMTGSFVAGPGTAAVESGLLAIAPAAAWGLLVVGLLAYGYSLGCAVTERRTEMLDKEKTLEALEKELQRLKTSNSDFKKIVAELQSVDSSFVDMVSRIASIHRVWHMLAVDAQKLGDGLIEVHNSGGDPLFFNRRLRQIKVLYGTVKYAFEQYALSINKCDVLMDKCSAIA